MSLVRVTYASRATFPSNIQGGIESEVGRILMQSRRNNNRDSIGGVLHYGEGMFFQCLEGEDRVVKQALSRIRLDSRHKEFKVLSQAQISKRMFKDWSMKYVPIEEVLDSVLKRHDIESFDPYLFNATIINEVLQACVLGTDPVAAIGQPEKKSSAIGRFFNRLFG